MTKKFIQSKTAEKENPASNSPSKTKVSACKLKHLRNKTRYPCLYSLVRPRRMFGRIPRNLAEFFTRQWRHREHVLFRFFFFIYKIIFGLNKEKDDIRSAYVYLKFFHETVNFHNYETANTLLTSFLCFIALWRHTFVDQSKLRYYPNYFIISMHKRQIVLKYTYNIAALSFYHLNTFCMY